PKGGKANVDKAEASHGHVGVREASRHDYDALRSLFERFYREEGFSDAAIERIEHSLRDILEREETAAFVALIGDEVIGGAAMSTTFGLETGLYAELQDLFVEPEARRRGAGSALVDACLMWAERMGCADVEIVLTAKARANQELLDWYAKRGFKDTGRALWERDLRKHD
ncbi:MAG: GNAT family N-acetyltransferase, partial [Bauldia litoralis]